jgi:hypothetical protein
MTDDHAYSEAVAQAERVLVAELALQQKLHAAHTAQAQLHHREAVARIISAYMVAKVPLEQERDFALRQARRALQAETEPADADLAHGVDEAERRYAEALKEARKPSLGLR